MGGREGTKGGPGVWAGGCSGSCLPTRSLPPAARAPKLRTGAAAARSYSENFLEDVSLTRIAYHKDNIEGLF